MSNYQKGKIYKLWSPSKNLVYYGSTIETLEERLTNHKYDYKSYKKTNHYISSFIVLECEDYKIELVEEYPCNNKTELEKKEGEYIRANECVNCRIAGRTKQEYTNDTKEQKSKYDKIYKKQYTEKHREELKEKDKIYRQTEQARLNVNARQKKYRKTKKENEDIYKWLTTTGILQ
jgi:hypothetical protein